MPGLGSFAGEFEQTFARASATEATLLTAQEIAHYEITSADGTLIGRLQVLYTPALTAQALEYVAVAPGSVAEIALTAQSFLPEDAAFAEELIEEPEHLLRYYASIALGEMPELGALSTDGDRGEPTDPGVLTLEITPSRWLLRPGYWAAALHDG
jgi:hypothetical protein